jgi:hypothetical protein
MCGCAGDAAQLLARFGPSPACALVLPFAAPACVVEGVVRTARAALRAAASRALSASVPSLRMRLAHLPLDGEGAAAGASPRAVLQLLQRLQPRRLLATGRDLALLDAAAEPQQPASSAAGAGGEAASEGAGGRLGGAALQLAREGVVTYAWLSRVRVPLPRNVQPASADVGQLAGLAWVPSSEPGVQVRCGRCGVRKCTCKPRGSAVLLN